MLLIPRFRHPPVGRARRRNVVFVTCAAALLATLACTIEKTQPPKTVEAIDSTRIPATRAERDFLRALSNHHAGLMFLAHVAEQHPDSVRVQSQALLLDAHHHQETDSILAVLHRESGEAFVPTVSNHHQALVDTLQRLSPADFDRRFRQEVIAHHREGLAMIDSAMPTLSNPRIIALVRRMREQQIAEIAALSAR